MSTTTLNEELQKQTQEALSTCCMARERLTEIEKFIGNRQFSELSFGEYFAVRAAVRDVHAVFDELVQKHELLLQLKGKATGPEGGF